MRLHGSSLPPGSLVISDAMSDNDEGLDTLVRGVRAATVHELRSAIPVEPDDPCRVQADLSEGVASAGTVVGEDFLAGQWFPADQPPRLV
jgi:hypothetical protein